MSSPEIYLVILVQILDETFYISYSANIFGKDMHPIIFLPAIGKIEGQTELFCFGIEKREIFIQSS